jgi:hypothetical protein
VLALVLELVSFLLEVYHELDLMLLVLVQVLELAVVQMFVLVL